MGAYRQVETPHPPKTIKRTMTPGPMASAASVLGAKEPTASPRDVEAKLSSVRIPQNLANLQQPQLSGYFSSFLSQAMVRKVDIRAQVRE